MTEINGKAPVACIVCGSEEVGVFIAIPGVPVHCNLLWDSQQGALSAPRGDIELAFCRNCGHVFNSAFEPKLMEYNQEYENSLHFSPRFQAYATSLATRLVERYDLHGKEIIEIGSGKGDFLKLMCDLGGNHGVGFDPSYVPDRHKETAMENITFVQDFYSERYADYQADMVCCRHVLEHIYEPTDFLSVVRRAIGDRLGTAVYFEVPNLLFTLRDLGIWDIIYEHCSYFGSSSLVRAFSLCGFDVCEVSDGFGGQFLCIEAFPGNGQARPGCDGLTHEVEIASVVEAFTKRFREKVETWQGQLARMVREAQRVVIWGAGSKGVTFLNALNAASQISYVVDINPHKQGMYVAGTGQQIVPPEFLTEYRPDVVVVMNAVYKDEIQQTIEGLGLSVDFLLG